MYNDKLVIIGASARAAAFSTQGEGIQTYAIDLFGDADLLAICEVKRIERFPDEIEIAMAESNASCWMYTGGLENYPDIVDRLANCCELLGNPGNVLRQVRDPFYLQESLYSTGFLIPEVRQCGKRHTSHKRWLLKPKRSAGGRGLRFWNSDLGVDDSHFLQEYVEGESVAAIFIACDGVAAMAGITKQLIGQNWTGAAAFQYAGSVGPIDLSPQVEKELRALGNFLASEFALRGLFGIDGIVANERFWLVEINPRYTASVEIVERILGKSLVASHIAACRGRLTLPVSTASTTDIRFGKAILYADRTFCFPAELTSRLLAENSTDDFPQTADIPCSNSLIRASEPILTVFAQGETTGEVEAKLQGKIRDFKIRIDNV